MLRPKEGQEVVLFEVLDKDIKATSTKPRSRRSESQTSESDEVKTCLMVSLDAFCNFCASSDPCFVKSAEQTIFVVFTSIL